MTEIGRIFHGSPPLNRLPLFLVLSSLVACTKTPTTPPLTSVFLPTRVASARPPVLVLLHGFGSNERDLLGLGASLDPRFDLYSLRGPLTLGPERFAWYPLTFTPDGPTHDPAEAERSRLRLITFLQDLQKTGADVYLLGFSQGTIMSLSIALTEPGLIKGVVAISGRVLPDLEPVSGRPSPRVLLLHGTADQVLPYRHALATEATLKAAGVPYEFQSFDAGHEISAPMRAAVATWLTAALDQARAP